MRKKPKTLKPEDIQRIEATVVMLLLSERDCYYTWLATGKLDKMPKSYICGAGGGGYYAEAYGIIRGLSLMGYCSMEAVNTPENITNGSWWFQELKKTAMEKDKEQGTRGI
jgi:hypothetical protein